ncbi:Chromosome segregation protein [Venturia nashicola]|uniref:Chromosome segregation protein n=1 Tax=Venturia nashicola TaxID=86259 RepID=A0A4Z1PCE4_9PEZI|nr:Chromosome segregation protein [Venturia nashicola]
MAASPSSSPRLPSPPPMAEDQLGPKSPIAGSLDLENAFTDSASQRIRPGTKAADMPDGPPLVPLKDIDSPFQLTEHLRALYSNAIHPKGSYRVVPIDRQTAKRLAQPPEGIDKYLWLLELCRFLCQESNTVIVALFSGDSPCSAQTCNEMRASEWQYLCAVHDPPKPCCAIDYCCHTLDWAATTLTSPKNFPSRLALGTAQGNEHQQLRQLTNIFRRVYRIFAHAWFQHREMFWKVESKSGIYVFFKAVCDMYGLIPEDNYTVPPEAEGIESLPPVTKQGPTLLKRGDESRRSESNPPEPSAGAAASTINTSGHTTKRHRQTPSVDAGLITTVPEETEEDEDNKNSKAQEAALLSSKTGAVKDLIADPVKADAKSEAKMDDEHNPEDTPMEEAPPADVTEEPEEVIDANPSHATQDGSPSGEIAEAATAIEPSDALPSSSVLTSGSQSLRTEQPQASHVEPEDPQASESKKQDSKASTEPHISSTPTEVSSSEKLETSTPGSSNQVPAVGEEVAAEPLDKETDKTTENEPLEPVHQSSPPQHQLLAHQSTPQSPQQPIPQSAHHQTAPSAHHQAASQPIQQDESEGTHPSEAHLASGASLLESKAQTPTPTTKEEAPAEEEADSQPDDVVADPKADARDGEEATKTVED